MYTVYKTVFLAGKPPEIRSYTVYTTVYTVLANPTHLYGSTVALWQGTDCTHTHRETHTHVHTHTHTHTHTRKHTHTHVNTHTHTTHVNTNAPQSLHARAESGRRNRRASPTVTHLQTHR